MTLVLVAVLVGLAARLSRPARAPVRTDGPVREPASGGSDPGRPASLLRLRIPLVVLIVLGGAVVVGGGVGVVAGLGAGVVGWRVLGSVEHPAAVRRRAGLARDLPMAIHLLGASLRAGVALTQALVDVAAAVQGPVAEEFRLVVRRLELGLDPAAAWAPIDPALAGVGRALIRAEDAGVSVVVAVDRLAEEFAAVRLHRTAELARSVEVRAAAPLGLCFLPAFVLLGVVPMVVGIFSSMRLFG